jgi:cell wall-associated NlpC family hydrolase
MNPLTQAVSENTKALKELADVERALANAGYGGSGGMRPSSDTSRQTWLQQTPAQRGFRKTESSQMAGWNPGTIGGQPISSSQGPAHSNRIAPGPLSPAPPASVPPQATPQYSGMGTAMAAEQAYQQWQNRPSTRQQPNQSVPQASPAYVSGWKAGQTTQPQPPGPAAQSAAAFVSAQAPPNTFASWPASGMAQRPSNGGQSSFPQLPQGVYGGLGGLKPPGSGGSGSVPPGTPTPSGPASGGFFSGVKKFLSQNKTALGVGAVAGVVQAGANALNNYSTRNLNQNYDAFGNLYVLRNGGYSSGSYGAASAAGIRQLLPARNEATSPSDLIAGGAQILVNSGGAATFSSQLANATVSAALSPGLGIAGAAANQQAEGTNRANLAAMMMFGQGTRTAGGGQISEVQLANNLLNATMMGKSTAGITPEVLKDMLSQTGTLRANLQGYAQMAGLSPDAVDSLANILTAQAAYQKQYGTTQGFEQTVSAAASGDKSALKKLKGTGIEESVQQSIMTRQGSQISRDIDTQKEFIDTLKQANAAMTNFSNAVNSLLKGSPLGGLLGKAGGFNAGTGGRIGGTLGSTAAGAMIGTLIEPGVGTAIGAGIGAVAGFITGGASHNIGTSTPNSGQNATPASSGVSQAANAAIAYAQAQVGKPYVMGATGPNAYDCSGLIQAAYQHAGVSIPRVSSQQYQVGTPVPLDQIAPGDLVFPTGEDGMWGAPPGLPGHVMMALGPGPNVPVVEAASPSLGIRDSTINVSQIKGVRRVTNGVGTLNPNLNKTSTSSSPSSSDGSDSGGGSGAPATNTSMPAGAAQTSAPAALGMNEVDILGAVLGRAAWQGPNVSPSSLQSATMSGAVNGSALSLPAYSKGALSIDGDQTAQLHDGEMVLDSKLSRSVRSAILADIPRHTNAGAKTSPTLNFSQGSVVINVSGGTGQMTMQNAAKQFVDAVAADDRIQMIGAGL